MEEITNSGNGNNTATIDTGLRVDIMRKEMEDKNTLTHRGALLVGSGWAIPVNGGSKEQITYSGDNYHIGSNTATVKEDINAHNYIMETEELPIHDGNDDKVLVGTGRGATFNPGKVAWKKIINYTAASSSNNASIDFDL